MVYHYSKQLPSAGIKRVSRTNYHARTDWLQHHIKLVTRVPADFQQKNLSLNDQLDPKFFLMFSANTRYSK